MATTGACSEAPVAIVNDIAIAESETTRATTAAASLLLRQSWSMRGLAVFSGSEFV